MNRALSRLVRTLAVPFLLGPSLAGTAVAQTDPGPQPTVVRDVVLGRGGERATLVLRDGRIADVLSPDAPPPPGMRVVEGEGRLALPAFVDAATRHGCATPEPVIDRDVPPDVTADAVIDMREANRKGVQPAFRARDALAIEEADGEAWRKAGFGAALVAPGGQLLAGTSVLVTTRDAAMRDVVMRPEVFAHAAFEASGDGYPSTLMGYFAQLRQLFLDARHHGELLERYAAGRPGLRPPDDAELDAGRRILSGETRVMCAAESARDVERWIRLADEFGFTVAIQGGRDAWRVADALARRGIPVVMTLDWGEEVDDPDAEEKPKGRGRGRGGRGVDPDTAPDAAPDAQEGEEGEEPAAGEKEADDEDAAWKYVEPIEVRRERRRLWVEGRDSAIRLYDAGVRIAFGTAEDEPAKLLGRVRELVEAGLDADVALAALTWSAAELLGVERLGRLEPGYDASFALWTDDPLLEEKAEVAWLFVDGYPHEFELEDEEESAPPAEGVDVTGAWELETHDPAGGTRTSALELEMDEDGSVTGTGTTTDPATEEEVAFDVEGRLAGTTLRLEATLSLGGAEVSVTLELDVDGDSLSGESRIEIPGMDLDETREVTGARRPEGSQEARR